MQHWALWVMFLWFLATGVLADIRFSGKHGKFVSLVVQIILTVIAVSGFVELCTL
jgi:hypothetical protein